MTITVIIYQSDFTIINNVLTPLTIRALDHWCYLYPNSDSDCQENMINVTLGRLLRGFDTESDSQTFVLIPEQIKAICIALLKDNVPNHNFVLSQNSYDDTVFGGHEKAESVKNEMEKLAQVGNNTFSVEFIESVYLQTVIDDLKFALEAFLGKKLEHKKLIQRLKQGLAQMPACSDELLSHIADLRQAGRLSEEDDLAIKGQIIPENSPHPNMSSRFEQKPQNNIDKGDISVIDEPNDQKMIEHFNLFNFLIIVMVIVLLVWSLAEFYQSREIEIDKEKEEAEKALVEARYDDAENLASNINEYYAQTMVVAIKEIVATQTEVVIETKAIVKPKRVILPPEPNDAKLRKLLKSLQKNAENARKNTRLTTPPENSAVWWAAKMLEIEEKNADAKDILETVIDKYLEMYNKPDKLSQLSHVLNKPVLPEQTQLKDYATDEQRERITQLLGEEYWLP